MQRSEGTFALGRQMCFGEVVFVVCLHLCARADTVPSCGECAKNAPPRESCEFQPRRRGLQFWRCACSVAVGAALCRSGPGLLAAQAEIAPPACCHCQVARLPAGLPLPDASQAWY